MLYIMFFVALIGGGFAISLYSEKFCQFETFKSCLMSLDISQWGQTGDFFGGILNPFLTFIGLIFVIITIRQNQQALELSEKELIDTRKELEKSNAALQSQVITAEKQRFETTFFLLLSSFNERVRNLKITVSDDIYEGKECLKRHYSDWSIQGRGTLKINALKEDFTDFYENYTVYSLAEYFNIFYSIIGHIESCRLEEKDLDKRFYSNLVRIQLAEYELGLLFYSRLLPAKHEYEQFSPLLEKYQFFKYLEARVLADPSHLTLFETYKTQ